MTAESYSALINEWLRTRGLSLTRNDIPVPDDEYSDLGCLLADIGDIERMHTVRSPRTRVIPPAVLAKAIRDSLEIE
jgi:hypothetical protein